MTSKKLRPGQQVSFQYGFRTVQGTIKEDRGPIGRHGRVLYRIEFQSQPDWPEPSYTELPADEIEILEGRPAS